MTDDACNKMMMRRSPYSRERAYSCVVRFLCDVW